MKAANYIFWKVYTDSSIEAKQEAYKQSQSAFLEREHGRFLDQMNTVLSHIDGVARESTVAEMLENPGRVMLSGVEQTFRSLLLGNPNYSQIRWIDHTGRERIRLDQHNMTTTLKKERQLQDRSDRYYTQQALKLSPGKNYISRLDLNVELGKVVVPYEPTIRVIRRLPNASDGRDSGFLIINVDLQRFIGSIQNGKDGVFEWMVNGDGEWIKGPVDGLEWRFMFNESARIDTRFPGSWNQIREVAASSFEDGLRGWIIAREINFANQSEYKVATAEKLYLISYTPAERYRQIGHDVLVTFYLSLFILLLSAIVTYLMILRAREQQVELIKANTGFELAAQNEERLKEQVEARTRELDQLNRNLEYMVELRTLELQQFQDALDEHAIVSAADVKGDIIYVNDKFCEISGYSRDELIGRNHRLVRSDEHSPQFYQNMWATITSGKVWHGEIRNTKKGNSGSYWVQASIVPFKDARGKVVKYVSIRTDITYRKQVEERLIHASQEAENASNARDEFLASMSHELRTPLTAILGNSDLLLDMEDSPEKRMLVKNIHTASRNQLALVNDILDMSKIESGKFTIDEVNYDLSGLLRNVESMLAIRAKDEGLYLQFIEEQVQSHLLVGDPQRIAQILINLIGNALKFTERGGVTVTVSVEHDGLLFRITDTGIGMDPETVGRLFQRFEQAAGSTSRRFGGSGLGLFISQSLAELMQGSITVESAVGKGSTFTLSIPYQVSNQPVVASSDETDHRPVENEIFQGHVLIAEDTIELQLLEQLILERLGLQVTIANNGAEAVELASSHTFDLILMDMQMPVLDGVGATRQLREKGVTTPIVALTANVMLKHRQAFAEAGCNGYLEKPFDSQTLVKGLQRFLVTDRTLSVELPQLLHENKELRALFIEECSLHRAELGKAFSRKDWEQVKGIAHKIKGSGATMGLPELSRLGEEICNDIDHGNMDLVPALRERLNTEIDRILGLIERR